MRTYGSVQLTITKDVDQRQKLLDQFFSFDDTDAALNAEFTSNLITLAAGATDVPFNFGGVSSASLVVIAAYSDISVKLNGLGAPAIPVRKIVAVAGGAVLSSLQKLDQPGLVLWRGKVDTIHLTNPNVAAPADVFIAVVGNAA